MAAASSLQNKIVESEVSTKEMNHSDRLTETSDKSTSCDKLF